MNEEEWLAYCARYEAYLETYEGVIPPSPPMSREQYAEYVEVEW